MNKPSRRILITRVRALANIAASHAKAAQESRDGVPNRAPVAYYLDTASRYAEQARQLCIAFHNSTKDN